MGVKSNLRFFAFVQMQVTPVFRVAQDLSRFGEHRLRDRGAFLDGAVGGQKIGLAPLFPRFEGLAVDLRRKPHAEPFFQVKPDDDHLRAARKIRSIFPQRAVGGLVAFSNLQRFDTLHSKWIDRLFAHIRENALGLRVQRHRFNAELASVTGLLETAERYAGENRVRRIDGDRAAA